MAWVPFVFDIELDPVAEYRQASIENQFDVSLEDFVRQCDDFLSYCVTVYFNPIEIGEYIQEVISLHYSRREGTHTPYGCFLLNYLTVFHGSLRNSFDELEIKYGRIDIIDTKDLNVYRQFCRVAIKVRDDSVAGRNWNRRMLSKTSKMYPGML